MPCRRKQGRGRRVCVRVCVRARVCIYVCGLVCTCVYFPFFLFHVGE